jgi:hypothetical protein
MPFLICFAFLTIHEPTRVVILSFVISEDEAQGESSACQCRRWESIGALEVLLGEGEEHLVIATIANQ